MKHIPTVIGAGLIAAVSFSGITAQAASPEEPGPASQDPHLSQLVQELDVLVPRHAAGEFKWGTKLKIQEMCTDNHSTYLVTAENEAWPEGDDPSRLLTTWLKLHPGDPAGNWFRSDNLSTLADGIHDHNKMSIYHGKPWTRRQVNNYTWDHLKHDWRNQRTHDVFWHPDQLGLELHVDRIAPCGDQDVHREQEQMHRWLRGGSDPHSKLTIDHIADKNDGSNVYELVLYRETSKPGKTWDFEDPEVVLIGMLDYSGNQLVRIDQDDRYREFWGTDEPNFGSGGFAYYSEIYGWWPSNDCFEERLWKIDTESNESTFLPITTADGEGRRLENLREGRHTCLRYW